ncbi:hypothetical protein OXX69_003713 [Metschnikowia pulcherrima]
MIACTSSGISHLFSTFSLLSWICAQLPQIVSNYTTKSAEGISPSFLLLWFMGDFLSFTSCLLNDAALSFQIYLSMFFLANDLTLCWQYYYYNSVYPRRQFKKLSQNESEVTANAETHCSEVHAGPGVVHIRPGGKESPEYFGSSSDPNMATKETIPSPSTSLSSNEGASHKPGFGSTGTSPKLGKMAAASLFLNAGVSHAFSTDKSSTISVSGFEETLGLILAWGCTCVYVSSRCPQLYRNYLRKSVDGISPLLFGSALLGNLTYTLSVMTSCEFLSAEDKKGFFLKQLPYLLGSSGTIVFDIAYFYQRYIYREAGRDSTELGLVPWEQE